MVSRLADRSNVTNRPIRVPFQPRNRKRWMIAAGIAGLWALLISEAGSLVAGTVLLMLLAVAGILFVVALRSLGINSGHPWVQRMAARPWRDGKDVLQLGLRHLPEVLIVTPGGSLLAPNLVELRMNPGDLALLTEGMDISLIDSSATEVYEDQISAHSAGLASVGPVEVSVIGDPAVAPGRYRLKQGRPASPSQPAASAIAYPYDYPREERSAYPREERGHDDLAMARTVVAEPVTVAAVAPVPLLRLVTNGRVSQTRTSGARAGRGGEAELGLPDEPTVSRVHAKFTFSDGRWQITNLGRNGTTLNGMPLTEEQAIRDGDSIGWGTQSGALVSRVEIGWERAENGWARALQVNGQPLTSG
jgi:pSer/pThr/pTyr-binding forkhead associated (FHA) protein